MQDHLLTNPQYLGVCPLPGTIDHCVVSLPDEPQLRAIAYEQELRMQARRQKTLKLSVELNLPDYQLLNAQETVEVALRLEV